MQGYTQAKHNSKIIFLLTMGLVAVADQISKTWIRSFLAVGQSVPENGFFRITLGYNTGAAFGIFQGQSFALSIFAVVGAIILLAFSLVKHRRFPCLDTGLSRIALGLILGGTVGNLIDRLRLGYVTDFIDIGIWPSFNLADSSIVVGVALLAYTILFLREKKKDVERNTSQLES